MPLSFPASVYLLCILTSAACTFLLLRSYLDSRAKLLLWTAICFLLLTINNLVLFIDVILLPSVNLLPLRHFASVGAISVLVAGFIWEAD